jgi:DNA-binding transcriptional LysR family regulator
MVESRVQSLTLHQLQVFAAVAREGSFTRAAQGLFVSEPTVSEQIKLLEQVVGASLFSRASRRPIRMTRAGEKLVEAVDQVFGRLEEALREISALQRAADGRVVFGAGRGFGAYLLPALYAAFRETNPSITVQVEFAKRRRLLDSLLKRELDLAVVLETDDDRGLTWTLLSECHVVPVGAPGHPWARHPAVPFDRLAEERIILGESPSVIGRALERRANELGVELSQGWDVEDPEAQLQAAASGLGITLVPFHMAAPRVASGVCSVLQVEGFPIPLRWFVVSPGRDLTPPAQTFRDFLLSCQDDLETATLVIDELPAAVTRRSHCGVAHVVPAAHRSRN